MAEKKKRAVLAGSEKPPVAAKAKVIGATDAAERIEVTLMLRRPALLKSSALLGAELPEKRRYLSHTEFREQLGAAPADVAKVDEFARQYNLTVVETHIPARTIKLSGTVADITAAFETGKLSVVEHDGKRFRARTGTLSVPPELADIVVGVYGIDDRPAVKRRATTTAEPKSKSTTFSVPQVAKLYDFPAKLDGSGQCIAIIQLNDVNGGKATGGGFRTSDLDAYFKGLHLPVPQVSVIGVDGGGNMPGPAPGFDQEVALDIEVAGAAAPGAHLAVYFGPNTTRGFIDAVSAAVHDDTRKPSVVSISWGSTEDAKYTDPQLVHGLNEVLQDAVALGITVCVATGDLGSANQIPPEMDGKPHVDAPGCSPFALACGGTKLTVKGETIASEVVWNDGARSATPGATGGGVSNVFDRPVWQSALKIPKSPEGKVGRGVPDIAAHAATSAGYEIILNGKKTTVAGTSAVAPLIAGLIARINQRLTTLGKPHAGFINPLLYKSPSCFREITEGNNDLTGTLKVYDAGKGWNACTGLGSPNGTAIMTALGG